MYKELKINERIAEARKAKGVSQKELATKTGLSSSAISAYEQGTRNPTKENYQVMAKILDVPLLWLMGLDDGVAYSDAENEIISMLHEKKQIDIEDLRSNNIELIVDGRKATDEEITIMCNVILGIRGYKEKD